jgi:Eco57I restriction-modification methylase
MSSASRLSALLRNKTFVSLFIEELGWDRMRTPPTPIEVETHTLILNGIAEKRGFSVLEVHVPKEANIEDKKFRALVEREALKLFHEHILILIDEKNSSQCWMWTKRETGKSPKIREVVFKIGSSNQALYEKLKSIAISFEEEQDLTIGHVRRKVQQNFDVEKVTKKFYDRFQTEHKTFLSFIKGVSKDVDREWYCSLMLNRLMFVYFIQKRGFLDGDVNYLRARLARVKEIQGKDKFFSFYKHFLIRLFHEGLGSRKRTSELEFLIGKVPYLNGGLFDIHEIEKSYNSISIEDKAFEKVLDFFDTYTWHLDDRPLSSEMDINPDVIGYIFEKYINQKATGAYYTKEDVTNYISSTTIVPKIIERIYSMYPKAFEKKGDLGSVSAQDLHKYLPAGLMYGGQSKVPKEEQRSGLSAVASSEAGLKRETQFEAFVRTSNRNAILRKTADFNIKNPTESITLNVDLSTILEDVIKNSEDSDFIYAVVRSIQSILVIDPACGSGAFLFAALNCLYRIYKAAIDRLYEISSRNSLNEVSKSDVITLLDQIRSYPSKNYYLLKNIILRNLYGVDIMKEAVEICKLRLFLRIVAELKQGESIEPLPDIDFNIRHGNSLFGFFDADSARRLLTEDLSGQQRIDRQSEGKRAEQIIEQAEIAGRAFNMFRLMQVQNNIPESEFTNAKYELRKRLDDLRTEADMLLFSYFQSKQKMSFEEWRDQTAPFHWFIEYFEIMSSGGFSAVIGNPPYIEISKLKNRYPLSEFRTRECGNLYAPFIERGLEIAEPNGMFGFIVPVSLVCTDRMQEARQLLLQGESWISSYDIRPSCLFSGVAQRTTIVCLKKGQNLGLVHMAGYRRWFGDERSNLFGTNIYGVNTTVHAEGHYLLKASNEIERSILQKIAGPSFETIMSDRGRPIYVHRIVRYFIKALSFVPRFVAADGTAGKSEDYKEFKFPNEHRDFAVCLLNSSLFYWFWRLAGDGFHCGYGDVKRMPFKAVEDGRTRRTFTSLHEQLMKDLRKKSIIKAIKTKKGKIEYQEFYIGESMSVIHKIDEAIASHYDFTEQERLYIKNYDLKYRLGDENEQPEEAAS